MRKILIILITIISVAVVALVGWYLFVGDPKTPTTEVIRNILPFGAVEDAIQPATNPSTLLGASNRSTTTDELSRPTANLFRISDTPVAGSVVFTKNAQAIARYVDRATGHIYDVNLSTREKAKVTNQTLPKIYEAYFRADGNAVLLRSLKDNSDIVVNQTLTLTAPKSTSTDDLHTVSSTAIRGDIGALAVGSGNTLFYALRDTSSVVSSAFNGTGVKTLFSSPFTDWRLASALNSLIVYTKASTNVAGYAYTVNTSNGTLTKILGPLNGLTAIPNTSGNRVLYSYVEGGRTRLFVKNIQSKALSEILPRTLAEKCIWSIKKVSLLFCGVPTDDVGVGEPDNWYRGVTHFSDRVWLFDTNTEIAQVLAEPKQSFNIDMDIFEPKLSPNEDYLIFTNKTDLSLWALKLD
jgi:hypothetical protein